MIILHQQEYSLQEKQFRELHKKHDPIVSVKILFMS